MLRSLGQILIIALVGMTAFKIVKELIHPTSTLWQSHVVPILFSGGVAVLAGVVVLHSQAQLQQILAGDIAERTQVEERLRHAQEELEQQVKCRTVDLMKANAALPFVANELGKKMSRRTSS